MIEHLKSVAIFAAVVECGSFRGAASRLGLSPSVISENISGLERKLGAALLYRSTRSLSLTEDGKRLYPEARRMLQSARDGLDQFAKTAGSTLTTLRIAIPAIMNAHPIVNGIAEFARAHPGVLLHLHSSDRQTDMQREGYDIAIRMGFFKDSELKTRRIGEDYRTLVAAPSYLARNSEILSPSDLAHHDFVSFSQVPDLVEFRRAGEKPVKTWGRSIIMVDAAESARMLVVAGLGLAALPFHAVKRDLKDGLLRELLPDWDEKTLPIYLTWPGNADLSPVTRDFINFMSAA